MALGLPGWDDSWAALALTNPQITLLTLFHRGIGPAEAAVPLPWLVDVPSEMEAVFPSELSDWTLEWDPTTAICSMCATRTVRRALAGGVAHRPTESHVERRRYDLTPRTEAAAAPKRAPTGLPC
jgi:hypothetical protein